MNNQIGNKINDKTYIPLTPFKGFVLENFPFIEADFDAITNYQLLCKVIEYLNNVISNQNTVQELGTDLVNAYNSLVDAVSLAINSFEEDITGDFNDLKNYVDNYFDNNFPQLVSNKLDEMAEDGTLQNLLDNYANVQKTYNTYTELIADSSTFINGLRLKTLGYYEVNDGGQAEYIITNTADTTKYQVELSNSLYLELINDDVIKVKQFGAYGDNTHDDTLSIQTAINYVQEHNGVLLLNNGIYKITSPLTITKSFVLKGTYNKGEITGGYLGSEIIQSSENTNLINFTTNSIYNMQIKDIRFKGNGGRGLNVDGIFFSEYSFESLMFNGGFTDAIYLNQATIGDIRNCVISANNGGINLANVSGIIFTNNNFWNNVNYGIKFGTVISCYFLSNWFENDNTRQYPNLLFQAPTNVSKCVFKSNGFQNSGKENIKVDYITNITQICRLTNNTFSDCTFQCSYECSILINNNDGNGNRNSNGASYFANNTINNCEFNYVQNYCVKTDYEQINMLFNNCNIYSNYGYSNQILTNSQTNKITTKTENNTGLLVNTQYALEQIKHTGLLRSNSLYMDSNNRLKWRDNSNVSNSLALLRSGASTDRPVSPERGTCYFDTTINKPIWYNHNAQWVDSTGTVV